MKQICTSLCLLFFLGFSSGWAQQAPKEQAARLAAALESRVIAWRRDIHQHPELSNREFRTAAKVEAHLRALGITVKTGVAKTGVVGILKGGKPGPVIGLRADMDALPVAERVDLPFKSVSRAEYGGDTVSVMHACGHDAHVAILMGVAEILSTLREQLSGTVVFVFQPAEEGPPAGEEGGAPLMIKEGLLRDTRMEVMFGLHLGAQSEVGKIHYREGGVMAASDWFDIRVKGVQSHGSQPWSGIDPIVVSAEIIMGLQTIISRQVDLTDFPAVITVGKIESGVRANIIPELAHLIGTIRTLDTGMQALIHRKIEQTVRHIAASAGATTELVIDRKTPVTYNHPELTRWALPSLREAAGKNRVEETKPKTGAEDFGFFAQQIPCFFFFLGGMPAGKNPRQVAAHHTPDFYLDEGGFVVGMKAFCNLVLDYMEKPVFKSR
jgi:amidohydrolase